MAYLERQLVEFLSWLQPDLVVYEGYAMGAKFQAHQLGELGGIFKLAVWRAGVDLMIVNPSALKKALLGAGVAKRAHPKAAKRTKAKVKEENKQRIIDAVAAIFHFDIPQNDEADAAALMFLGEARFSPRQSSRQLDLSEVRKCEILPGMRRLGSL